MLIKNGKVLLFEENGFVKRDLRVKDGKNFRRSAKACLLNRERSFSTQRENM